MKKKKRLTKKQQRFVGAIANPEVGTIAEAAKIAGYCDRQYGSKVLQSTTIQDALKFFLDKLEAHGATDHVAAHRIAEGLSATKTVFFQHKGIVKDSRVCIDYPTRFKYIELCLKIKQYIKGGGSRTNYG